MLFHPLTEQQARAKLQEILDWNRSRYINYSDSKLIGANGTGYVEHFFTRMLNEFGGQWDGRKATEFINALAAENGLRDI